MNNGGAKILGAHFWDVQTMEDFRAQFYSSIAATSFWNSTFVLQPLLPEQTFWNTTLVLQPLLPEQTFWNTTLVLQPLLPEQTFGILL